MTKADAQAARAVPSRRDAETRLLDAAERLLVNVGYAAITTRMVADEAGMNNGLVHYYFGSMEELFLQVLERFTGQLIERQREMYASDVRYIEKWRDAMRYLDEDRPYQKIWWELQAMAWNHREYRQRVAAVHAAWCGAMREAVAEAVREYALDDHFTAEHWVTMIVALNEGIILERLAGVSRGHDELLDAIDRWLTTLEKKKTSGRRRKRR